MFSGNNKCSTPRALKKLTPGNSDRKVGIEIVRWGPCSAAERSRRRRERFG
jgi:hypothetical protein